MKKWHNALKVLAIVLSLFLAFPCGIVSAAAKPNIKIKHDPPKDYVPGFRITLDTKIKEKADVLDARCYFKTKKDKNFVFVDMVPNKGNPGYQTTLPAPWVGSEYVEYAFVVVNKDKEVIRTQMFRMEELETEAATTWQEATEVKEIQLDKAQEAVERYEAVKKDLVREYKDRLPKHQQAEARGKLDVLTEFVNPSGQLKGFYDNIMVTTVPSSAKYGVLAEGLYTEAEIAAIGGTNTIAASTGAVTAGTITATGAIGLGTIAVAALVAGGAAAAAGGGGGSSSSSSGGDDGGATQLFPLVLPPNGSATVCCDLELWPIAPPPVPVTVEHPGMATTTWDGTFPIGYASIGSGVGRLTLTSDVAGGIFMIHFPVGGGSVNLTVNGSAGDYILFQTQ